MTIPHAVSAALCREVRLILPQPRGAMHQCLAYINNIPWMNAHYLPEVMP